MPEIKFVLADGTVRALDASDGASVMETAVKNGVPGIVAECGGACACATCHVYVAEDCLERVGPPDEWEDEMLDDAVAPRLPTSRLSCQIKMSSDLDGVVVTVAPEQQ